MRDPLSIEVEVEGIPDATTRQIIDQGLDEYNFSKAGPDNAEDLWVIARDGEGLVKGGVKARTFYAWMFIDWLWVSNSVRGAGVGSLLMDKAEAVARERGCIGAYVDTFSFQAPGFYRSRGYEEFGRIDGLPAGHACIWLRKTFVAVEK
jgi:GNAT superfamily N-acetyltransferase